LVFPDSVCVKITTFLQGAGRGYFTALEEKVMPTGTVKWFNPTKGFGFIEPEDGSKDAFVHISAVERAGMSTLNEGQKVNYDLEPGRDGKASAENLSAAD
jgi:CspA family cold shock protein